MMQRHQKAKLMIDLHLHLDGSLRPATVRELLSNKGVTDYSTDKELASILRAPKDCSNLNDYLTSFEYPTIVLQNQSAIERSVYELGEDLAAYGITYAEIRFAPLLATRNGMSIAEAVEAAIAGAVRAEQELAGLRLGLILCCMRGSSHEQNMLTVEAARTYLGNHVCALDLAGAEALYPAAMYEEEFHLARKYDIPFTIHAGEAAGPESVWAALELGASRIGHGIRSIEDNALVDYLVRYEIPLEICPTSNMQTRVYNLDMYPLKELLNSGVHVTLNSDNMTVSDTNILKERQLVMDCCGITQEDIDRMEQYSREAAFLL